MSHGEGVKKGRVEKKAHTVCLRGWGSNSGPIAWQARVSSCMPWSLFRQVGLSVVKDRLGRLHNHQVQCVWIWGVRVRRRFIDPELISSCFPCAVSVQSVYS